MLLTLKVDRKIFISYICKVRKLKTISAIILLGIYAVMFLHSSIPHFHHSSEVKTHKHEEDHHDHHGHLHNHDHSSNAEASSILAFFSDLLHNHEHQNDEIDTPDEYTINHTKVNLPTQIVAVNFDKLIIQPERDLIACKLTKFIERPPILYEEYLNISDPLRGPPLIIS